MSATFRARGERFARNQRGRDFAVGDIHGCFTALQRALEHIAFDPAVDRLFAIGDLVDRGPESHAVRTWLDKPWFHAICGNHELMTWRSTFGDPCPDVNHLEYGGEWLQVIGAHEQEQIAERLMALPLFMEIDTPEGMVGLIHADCPCDNWTDMQQADWANFGDAHYLVETCLWSIARYELRYANVVRNIRAVVHGHMTVKKVTQLGNVFYIDTGGWKENGRFSFLNLHTLKVLSGPQNGQCNQRP